MGRNAVGVSRVCSFASDAEAVGNDAAANEAWRRYRLISDTLRDLDELLAEGIALSQAGIELAAADRGSR
jgi:hypothetical protein